MLVCRQLHAQNALAMPLFLLHPHRVIVCQKTSGPAVSNMACRQAKVWKLPKTGNIGNLTLVEHAVPEPSAGSVTVAVQAVGINFADVFTCLGLYAAAPKVDVVPGLEFAGVVTDIGPTADKADADSQKSAEQESAESELRAPTALSDLQIGDRVLGACRFGSYATHLNISAQQVLKVPDGWSFSQAAGFLVQSLTAYYGLKSLGNIRKGSCVLIHSAAGGCGLNAIAICLAVGATPIGTVGSPDKVQFLLERYPALKPAQVIVRDSQTYTGQLQSALQAVGRDGFDIVLDAVAGEFFQPSYQAMAKGGRHIVFGAANWTPTGDKPGWLRLAWQHLNRSQIDPMQMIGDNKSVMGFNLIWMFDKVSELAGLAQELLQLDLPAPHTGDTFSFEDAPAALRRLQSGKTVGKVVLEVGEFVDADLP